MHRSPHEPPFEETSETLKPFLRTVGAYSGAVGGPLASVGRFAGRSHRNPVVSVCSVCLGHARHAADQEDLVDPWHLKLALIPII